MGTQLELQAVLETIVGNDRAYFQPPSTLTMTYPCIVYKLDDIRTEFADNDPYGHTMRYLVTLIDPRPDSVLVKEVINLRMCTFDRTYAADSLNHFVFQLFF